MPPADKTLYFAYGSNLWLAQMSRRCPSSTYLGIARLCNYRWLINERGYANVVSLSPTSTTTGEKEDFDTVVYGMLYALTPDDEARLDVNEGVPDAYTKEYLDVDFWKGSEDRWVDVGKEAAEKKKVLVYVDRLRIGEGPPKGEYVGRMNEAVRDAVRLGVPQKWVEGVVRKFIPEEGKS